MDMGTFGGTAVIGTEMAQRGYLSSMIINFRSVEHCAPIIATVWRAMGSFGTQFGHHGEILQHFGLPTRWLGAHGRL